MQYSEARPLIRSGDLLGFSYRNPMFSGWYAFKVGLVRLALKSEYSHVGVAWCAAGRVFILEAVMPRVRIYPLSVAMDEGEDIYHLQMGVDWTPKVEDFAMQHIGQKYSELKAMTSPLKPWVHGEYTECAGFALDVLHEAKVNLGVYATPPAVILAAQRRGSACNLITREQHK